MTKQEYLDKALECGTDKARVAEISEIYGREITGFFGNIISFADKADFISEEKRLEPDGKSTETSSGADEPVSYVEVIRPFTYKEIVGASGEYEVDFKALGVIPFMDAFDGDLIVYIPDDGMWAMYSISDDVVFKKRENLSEVM